MGFTILLDPYAFADNEQGLDWGLRVVASLCREFHNHACDLTCQLGNDQYSVAPSTASLHRVFDRLAAYCGSVAIENMPALRIPAPSNRQAILVTSAKRWHALGNSEIGARNQKRVRAVVLEEDSHQPDTLPTRPRNGL